MEITTRQTAFSILYAANGMQLFDVFQLTDACDCDEESVGDYLYGRKPIPQSFKDALSKLMATKYYTLSGFNRNAR
jgi:hypothetical protein